MISHLIFISVFLYASESLASDQFKENHSDMFWTVFFLILSAIIGYIVGSIKSFREEKQKAYGEILPPILKMAYHPETTMDEKEFSKPLSKLWLYGSKRVTEKMEYALKIMHDSTKGNVTKALQEAVVEMRKDIQIWSWQKLKPEDVHHLYTRIAGGETKNKKDKT